MKQKEDASELARQGVVFTPRGYDGVSVAVAGKPARLAVVSEDGQVVALGQEVEEQFADASVLSYQMMLQCEGLLRSVQPALDEVEVASR
jgi:hypothetical protein